MTTKIHLLAFCSVITFILCTENVKAENKIPTYDSTCCRPDSLRFISANYPIFCVSWKIPSDSMCRAPQGFEIQWKLLSGTIWKTKVVTYTSGTTITFCDSTDSCGLYVWRVRTICNDSTYSDWVNGNKFTMLCDHDIRDNVQNLSISPNPASERITINTRHIKPGQFKISIVNMVGKNVLEKIINTQGDDQLREKLSVSGWQKGIYFVNIFTNGVVISRGSFVKE